MISRLDVEAAASRIAGRVRHTPVAEVDPGTFGQAGTVWLKLEFMQHTGTFKARGAFNRILWAAETGNLPPNGVVAASGGNHGIAVAYAAQTLGVSAEVYVPATIPAVKLAQLEQLGASVIQGGREYADAYNAAVENAAKTGALFCHAYDQPEICAGQGTIAMEIQEQTGGVDTVILAAGGGGLMAGVAAALEDQARVVAVEPDTIPTLHDALAAGQPVDVGVSGVAVDALGCRRLGDIAYNVAVRTGIPGLLVSDDEIVAARRTLWQRYRVVVEHGAAAAFAALLFERYVPRPGERIAVLLCGANTDLSDLAN